MASQFPGRRRPQPEDSSRGSSGNIMAASLTTNNSSSPLTRPNHIQTHPAGLPAGVPTTTSQSPTSHTSPFAKRHHHGAQGAKSPTTTGAAPIANYRGHQRRQSVARLLPDISKLRLLSWLVEASNELINCDIAIMDGVYAKLNKSRESLLFWSATNHVASSSAATASHPQRPPAPPTSQPVANKIVISQHQQHKRHRQQQNQLRSSTNPISESKQLRTPANRNHHSLPTTNYDSSSLAAVSLSPYLLSPSSLLTRPRGSKKSTDNHSIAAPGCSSGTATSGQQQQSDNCDSINEPEFNCDNVIDTNHSDLDDDEDDDNCSAASSTTSSGIHGGETSISSNSSSAASSSDSSSCSVVSDIPTTSGPASVAGGSGGRFRGVGSGPFSPEDSSVNSHLSSAEQISERIRRTVMEHNYLQSLLVNVIRQHDRQRNILNQQQRQLQQIDHNSEHNHLLSQQIRIDLADIADALDDGCLCSCHSMPMHSTTDINHEPDNGNNKSAKSSTLPAVAIENNHQTNRGITLEASQVPVRKVRRLKRFRSSDASGAKRSDEINRQDIINQLAGKLCENCFETHYWLHGCSVDLTQQQKRQLLNNKQTSSGANQDNPSNILGNSHNNGSSAAATASDQDLNAIISIRNATFIKLVQQQVRSTISKSIELIDLIRKEIKSPESIKQKQLMRCFSTSIQLLTSVGNYVVPAQDISTFIPEVGQQRTTLFCLPPSDFDHLLIFPSSSSSAPRNPTNAATRQQMLDSNYHLAPAPDIPIRRRLNKHQIRKDSSDTSSQDPRGELALSSDLQRLKTSDNLGTNLVVGGVESSSGASSNNSSASSSIARSTVQQSSLTRAHTSNAILDGKANHDLSFEAIANLSRQHTEDDMLFQSRPKFWQSSKFNFIKKLLHVKEQRLLRQQSKDRRIYNNKVQNKFRLVMRDLTHFNKSQQLLTTENGVNSLLTSMRNVLEFGLYLTLKLY